MSSDPRGDGAESPASLAADSEAAEAAVEDLEAMGLAVAVASAAPMPMATAVPAALMVVNSIPRQAPRFAPSPERDALPPSEDAAAAATAAAAAAAARDAAKARAAEARAARRRAAQSTKAQAYEMFEGMKLWCGPFYSSPCPRGHPAPPEPRATI